MASAKVKATIGARAQAALHVLRGRPLVFGCTLKRLEFYGKQKHALISNAYFPTVEEPLNFGVRDG